MKKTLSFIAIFIISGFFTGCGTEKSSSDQIMDFAETLVKVIDEFELAREKVAGVINEVADNMKAYLNNNDLNLSDKAKNWEKDWSKVGKEIVALEENFLKVDKNSRKYFEQLYALTEAINNDELRQAESAKNEKLQKKWNQVYEEAEGAMEKIRGVVKEGADFHKVLLSSAMRAKIGDNIEQIKGISSRAQKILNTLGRFSVESKKVLKGEQLRKKILLQKKRKKILNLKK